MDGDVWRRRGEKSKCQDVTKQHQTITKLGRVFDIRLNLKTQE